MFNHGFLEKGLRIDYPPYLCMIFQGKCFSYYILLTYHISLSDCLYFLRYWVICVLQVFVSKLCRHKFQN